MTTTTTTTEPLSLGLGEPPLSLGEYIAVLQDVLGKLEYIADFEIQSNVDVSNRCAMRTELERNIKSCLAIEAQRGPKGAKAPVGPRFEIVYSRRIEPVYDSMISTTFNTISDLYVLDELIADYEIPRLTSARIETILYGESWSVAQLDICPRRIVLQVAGPKAHAVRQVGP